MFLGFRTTILLAFSESTAQHHPLKLDRSASLRFVRNKIPEYWRVEEGLRL